MEGSRTIPALRVLQWNILADGLAQFGDFVRALVELAIRDLQSFSSEGLRSLLCAFAQVPKHVLEWSSRAPKLLNKILEADADIVCLQEINHYDDFFLPQLQQHGYSGRFKPKQHSPAVRYGFPPDGCAIFFRAARFTLVEQEVQSQNSIVCYFKDLKGHHKFLLATTHLKAKAGKENDTIRLRQVQALMENLVIASADALVPCIICGDFNTNPHTDVYEFLHEHTVGLRSIYACSPKIPSAESTEPLIIQLDKSCDGGAITEPPFTTWKFRSTGEKQETIDYIWFSKNKEIVPYRVWRLPSAISIGPDGLPSEDMPSDHLPLLCEFAWKQDVFMPEEPCPVPSYATT